MRVKLWTLNSLTSSLKTLSISWQTTSGERRHSRSCSYWDGDGQISSISLWATATDSVLEQQKTTATTCNTVIVLLNVAHLFFCCSKTLSPLTTLQLIVCIPSILMFHFQLYMRCLRHKHSILLILCNFYTAYNLLDFAAAQSRTSSGTSSMSI